MEIKELINEKLVLLDLKAESKAGVIKEMTNLLEENDRLLDREAFQKAVLDREEMSSTGIGMGVAIPHGKSAGVKKASLVFGRHNKGMDFDSLDGKPTNVFFLIAVPDESNDIHLRILSKLSRSLMHEETRTKLANADRPEDIIEILNEKLS